jgi:hypothetical protein
MENAAKLSWYNEIQAQAWAIAARYRQEQHIESSGSDSDSELSVLARSLFKGMGGIESGQSVGVDVEMGGTTGGLVDQDVQDDG